MGILNLFFNKKREGKLLNTTCSVCKKIAAKISLTQNLDDWHLKYEGLRGGNGAGDAISAEKADAITLAFKKPYLSQHIKAAGFYDDAGFCIACEKFYCAKHWQLSTTGGGTCPAGHFKSLDPQWSPE